LCARGVDDADVSALSGAVSGYVADSPATMRAALEPLMAAFAFDAAERDGRIVFFHSDAAEPLALNADALSADSVGDLFAQRGDAAEAPVEARVRFLDAGRDYALGGVSARRLDWAEGGVETLEAPLVLEADTAEQLAQRLLAARRAGAETLRLGVGPAHAALESGDAVCFGGQTFEIGRIEDAETRTLELRRIETRPSALLHLAEASAPSLPGTAPKPALALLYLPPQPGAEDEERPLAAVFAAPWLGLHQIYAGGDDASLTRRGAAAQPAVMGELLWALWPGPVGRMDEGNRVRIKLYGGVLASVTKDVLLNGANAFAVESADGEWEILQAMNAVLTAPNEYELSGFLRGQQGSEHAMRAPAPVGARIVKLDARLARVDIAAHEWSAALRVAAPPARSFESSTRAARADFAPLHAAQRPWAPAHLRARRLSSGDVAISWIRRARIGGDHWGSGEPPIGAPAERYRLDILDGGVIKRSAETDSPNFAYSAADQAVDFGSPPSSLSLRVAQLDGLGAPGLNKDLTIPL
jgi:Putative phage tail protein